MTEAQRDKLLLAVTKAVVSSLVPGAVRRVCELRASDSRGFQPLVGDEPLRKMKHLFDKNSYLLRWLGQKTTSFVDSNDLKSLSEIHDVLREIFGDDLPRCP